MIATAPGRSFNPSLVQQWADLDAEARAEVVERLGRDKVRAILAGDWSVWARPDQLAPPGDWTIWLILAGRGWGKTLTGAEDVKAFGLANPGSRIAIVAPTYSDARDTCIEGETGLLNRLDRGSVKNWNRSMGELLLANGTRFKLFSSDEPERLRGPQHHRAWCDELAAWKYPQDTFDMLMFGLRLGERPQLVATTTPKPIPLVRELVLRAGKDVSLTRGSTFDNRENLAPTFVNQVLRRYRGTRLERQELFAEVLEDTPGALWLQDTIDAHRLWESPAGVTLTRVVVAIDPAATSEEGSSETGIVCCGLGSDRRGYVLEDASLRGTPEQWARAAIGLYDRWQADLIVGEANNGGDMIEAVLRSVRRNLPYKKVVASRGKQTRAEPIAALYTQGRVSHCGLFRDLEAQMTGWVPGLTSPDRLDALAWSLSELMLGGTEAVAIVGGRRPTLATAGRMSH